MSRIRAFSETNGVPVFLLFRSLSTKDYAKICQLLISIQQQCYVISVIKLVLPKEGPTELWYSLL